MKNVQGSIAFSSAEVTSDWLAQEVSHMRSRRQANLAKLRLSQQFAVKGTALPLSETKRLYSTVVGTKQYNVSGDKT